MNNVDLISVVCPCYNHEMYLEKFIEKILIQDYSNFELIIVDDCSSDNSHDIINKFADLRIKYIKHLYKQGINQCINSAIKVSSGKYIVLCPPYVLMKENALTKYLFYFKEQPIEFLFPYLKKIKEDTINSFPKTRSEFLHSLFYFENEFSAVGIATTQKLLNKVLPLPTSNTISKDYKMIIELLAKSEVLFIKEEIIELDDNALNINLNNDSNYISTRFKIEEDSLMDSFLKIKNIKLLREIFLGEIAETGVTPYIDTVEFFLGRMALAPQMNNYQRKVWGYHRIMNFYNKNIQNDILKNRYNFCYKDLLQLTNLFIPFKVINNSPHSIYGLD